jgi:alcohol dehydrogenase class IV
MSKTSIDGLRHAYEAYCRGDIQGAVDSIDIDPNILWIEPKEFSAGGTYQGRQGVIDCLTRAYAANEKVQNVVLAT